MRFLIERVIADTAHLFVLMAGVWFAHRHFHAMLKQDNLVFHVIFRALTTNSVVSFIFNLVNRVVLKQISFWF